MRQMSRIFFKWYYYFLHCRLFYIFALVTWRIKLHSYFAWRRLYFTHEPSPVTVHFLRRRQHQHCYRDVPWVVDSHWIIASVLRITCLLFSIFSGYQMTEPPLKKMAPKRKCKFNEDWMSLDSKVAWRSLICATDFYISSGGPTDVAGTMRVQTTLSWRRVRSLQRVGWSSSLCRPWTKWSRRCYKSGNKC